MALLAAVVIYAVTSSAAPTVPVPDPIVMVHTESGGVVRDTPVPIGGAPVPIDVDDGKLLGLLSPDIDVSVGLVSVPELPANVLVPNIVVKRNLLAVTRHAASPPLKLNARVIINDAGNLKRLATVDYGFETPPGARIPPIVTAKLVGPPTSGFIDPLKAKIETPGYGGPLQFNIKATTSSFEGTFALKFDPLPEAIAINEDPRDDGLDFTYDHTGTTPDVKLDASADIKSLPSGRVRHIGAVVERLPNHIQVSNTQTQDDTVLEYVSGSDLGKPDVEADYRDTLADGTIVNDGNAKISGLPSHIRATIGTRPNAKGTTDVDSVKFDVLDGGEIDAVDFVARNWLSNPGTVPEYNLGPEQFVSMVSRRQADGTSLYRAAGRLLAVRGGAFKRTGASHDQLDVTTDVGNGTVPLRGILDLDNRGAPKEDDPKRLFVDSTVSPLPSTIHVFYAPASGTDPLRLVYDSSTSVDVDTSTVIAKGAANDCGEDRVVCAQARVDKLPPHLEAKLPGEKGTDFSVSHTGTGTGKPDVRATVDVGPDSTQTPPSARTWAKVALLRVPNEVRGRMDTQGGELRAAEFHGCAFDFGTAKCSDTQGAIGRVTFTVRDQPARVGLPPRPDTADQFVTLLSRHKAPGPKHFEVVGRVDEVRNVAFHQLDLVPNDGKTDGVLGALVEVGVPHDAAHPIPFDVVVDGVDDAFDDVKPKPNVIGDDQTAVNVHVFDLPLHFSACVRSTKEAAPPGSVPADKLLAPCERTDVVSPSSGEHAVTPLSASYEATDLSDPPKPSPTKVEAHIRSTKPEPDDVSPAQPNPLPNTTALDLTIDKVPASLRADVIPPITPDPSADPPVAGRRLQLVYDASSKITGVDFALQSRRTTSICGDPRPNRKAMCLDGTLSNLPAGKSTTIFDPDDAKGTIDVTTPTHPLAEPLSIKPLHLSKVSPEQGSTPLVLSAGIEGITPHLAGKIQSLELDGERPPGNPTLPEQLATCNDTLDNDSDHKATDPPGKNIDKADSDCGKDAAQLSFDACPKVDGQPATGPDGGPCNGIDKITFTASNSLVGDPVPAVPVADPPVAGLDQQFSFVQSGEAFRADGVIRDFRNLTYSRLDSDGAPSRATSFGAGLGNGSPLRAYLDRDTGREVQRVDAILTNPPKTFGLCLRDKTNVADLKESGAFCEAKDANGDGKLDDDKSAVQISADPNGAPPDIDVRSLRLSKGGGVEVLAGGLKIEGLGQRIDALIGDTGGTDVDVEGHDRGDGPGASPKDVAKRVTFSLRNFVDARNLDGFPWTPLDAGATDPKDDARNDDPVSGNDPSDYSPGRNYLQLEQDVDGSLVAEGSVPHVKQVQLSPHPCPSKKPELTPETGFGGTPAPAYKCVHAVVAPPGSGPGHPLGMSVRTLDAPGGDTAKLDALSLESGHISKLPDALSATISKSPEGNTDLPLCSEHAAPCQPPVVSVEAPTSGGAGTIEARLATGRMSDLQALAGIGPADAQSQLLDYEQPPNDAERASGAPPFPLGARLKVGSNSDTGKTALRLGAKLRIPQYLDLNPPVTFSCTHVPVNPQPTDCSSKLVSPNNDRGYETKDIRVGLVAADDDHFGNPQASNPYLGRVAVMLQPLTGKTAAETGASGTQILLTGMPEPDDHEPVLGSSAKHDTLGGSSVGPEKFPCCDGDDSVNGFLAPAHVDAQVYLRNAYDTDNGHHNQLAYTQVDGRVNAPLSMTARFNPAPPGPDDPAFEDYSPPTNRGDALVPRSEISLFNAPSSNNQDNYTKPTFRLRAQLEAEPQKSKDPSIWDRLKKFALCDENFGINIGLANLCLVTPHPDSRYVDAQLNADPHSRSPSEIAADPGGGPWTTAGAARTVDVMGGPFGAENNIEVRGWQEVNGSGGPFAKGQPAEVSPVFDARLTHVTIGLKAGLAVIVGVDVRLYADGDLVVGTAGGGTTGMRLGANKNKLKLKSLGSGDSQVLTDLRAETHFAVDVTLWGLGSVNLFDLGTPSYPQHVSFRDCSSGGFNPFGDDDQIVATGGGGEISFSETFGVPNSWLGLTNIVNLVLGYIGGPIGCAFSASTSPIIGTTLPAPGYGAVLGHGVPDQGNTAAPGTPAPPPEPAPAEENLQVPATAGDGSHPPVTLCGAHSYEHVDVQGKVVVGASGTDAGGNTCNGTLSIGAKDVKVGSSGAISASATVSGGPGQPGSGAGGGAGHVGGGGSSGAEAASPGAGPGGSAYSQPSGGPAADKGSEGRDGTSVPAGKGGGTIVIAARDTFENHGTIAAAGGSGNDAPVDTGGACATGAGGGSGGAIAISSNLVTGGGTLTVAGGTGGDGGFGGGGGSGGRITIETVFTDNNAVADKGTGGGSDTGTCDPGTDANPRHIGQDGAAGKPDLGTKLPLISDARLNSDNPGPYTNQSPKIDLFAMATDASKPVEIILCHRRAAFTSTDPFGTEVDPHGTTVTALRANSDCEPGHVIDQPDADGHTFHTTVTVSNLFSGVHGFFAYAQQVSCPTVNDNGDPQHYDYGFVPGDPPGTPKTCFYITRKPNGDLIYHTAAPTLLVQDPLPRRSRAKIGYDPVAPPTPVVGHDTSTDCAGYACRATADGPISVNADDDAQGSGIARVECREHSSSTPGPWGDCSGKPTNLPLHEGVNVVDVRLVDRAGNEAVKDLAAGWFVDTQAPKKPLLTASSNDGAGKNGWHNIAPTIRLFDGYDPDPSSGFTLGNASVYVDEGKLSCGTADPADPIGTGFTSCDPVAGIPASGLHTLTATTTDRVGHTSPRSEPVTMKVDTAPPTSDLLVGPKKPDGENDWYRTRPFLAFGTSDGPGGSGVDSALDVDHAETGIHIKIDDDPWQLYDPTQDYLLGDGRHKVCWYAVDLAGNREDADPSTSAPDDHCKADIKVDTTAPTVTDPIVPASPNGANGFYVSKPKVTPDGSDPKPTPTTEISGLDKVQYQVDDGPWTAAAPFLVDEGEHEIRVRAFDVAGNPAVIHERTVRIDLSAPSAALGAYPPNPNLQGWFRQRRIDSVAVRDGRDGSGAAGATYKIDGGADATYLQPFSIDPGTHTAKVTPRDRAGLTGPSLTQSSKIDVTRPVATPSSSAPGPILISILGLYASTTFNYTVTDDLSAKVKVVVIVYDTLGNAVRHLSVPADGSYTGTGLGSVVWDGRNDADKGVLPGTYHFRVKAIDQAGNSIVSTESPVFLVVQGLLPQ